MGEMPFTSRAIEALLVQLRNARDDSERRLIRVRMAGVLARLAQVDEARKLVVRLRSENQAFESRLSSWIMFTEGLIAHFESLDTIRARDRFGRAHAIAVATGDRELRAISSAWMADAEFRLGNIASSLSYLETAFLESVAGNHEARERACAALGDLASWSGMVEIGRSWYRRAREHAVAAGDIGLQSAILFNSVSFRVHAVVVQDCTGTSNTQEADALLREVSSVANLDAGLNIGSLSTMVPALIAELKTVLKDWSAALAVFDGFVERIHLDGQTRLSSKFLAHRAWCNANLGDRHRAQSDALRAASSIDDCPDLDDLAIVHGRLGSVYQLINESILADKHTAMARRCMEVFAASQLALRQSVNDAIARIEKQEEMTRPKPGPITR